MAKRLYVPVIVLKDGTIKKFDEIDTCIPAMATSHAKGCIRLFEKEGVSQFGYATLESQGMVYTLMDNDVL